MTIKPIVAGFRTADKNDGPNDGSIYSFNADTQDARRFKRRGGEATKTRYEAFDRLSLRKTPP